MGEDGHKRRRNGKVGRKGTGEAIQKVRGKKEREEFPPFASLGFFHDFPFTRKQLQIIG